LSQVSGFEKTSAFYEIIHTLPVLKLRTIILQTTLPFAEYIRQQGKTDIVEAAMQGTTTILCTMLISLYLVFKQWQQRKLMGREFISNR
jgi:hypothetical protein